METLPCEARGPCGSKCGRAETGLPPIYLNIRRQLAILIRPSIPEGDADKGFGVILAPCKRGTLAPIREL